MSFIQLLMDTGLVSSFSNCRLGLARFPKGSTGHRGTVSDAKPKQLNIWFYLPSLHLPGPEVFSHDLDLSRSGFKFRLHHLIIA